MELVNPHDETSNLCAFSSPTTLLSTCFNRIDLPLYENKEELQEKLKLAVTMQATGFDIE